MRDASDTPRPHTGLDLGVMQAMLDIGEALAADAGKPRTSRQRADDGFLPGSPDHYARLAEAIIDLVNAHPVLGPQELSGMLEYIETMGWRRQDRLPDRALIRRRMEAWRKRRREQPTETEKLIDLLRGGA